MEKFTIQTKQIVTDSDNNIINFDNELAFLNSNKNTLNNYLEVIDNLQKVITARTELMQAIYTQFPASVPQEVVNSFNLK